MSEKFVKTEHGQRCGDVELVWARNSKDLFFANTIVVHGSQPIIIDPSANFTYLRHLALSQTNFRIINTHYHTDHRVLNGRFQDAVFMCHREDAPALRSWAEFQRRLDQNPDSIYSKWVQRMWQQLNMHETPVRVELEDKQILESDQHRLEVVHIPGHTPGLIGILFADIGLLFTSDIDLTPYGPWYANEVSDIELFKQSIEKIRHIEVPHFITSHGQRIYTRDKFLEKLDHFENHFERREIHIREALQAGPKTLQDLTNEGIIYRKSLLRDPLKAYFSNKMIQKHLKQLEEKNEVSWDGVRYELKK